VTPSDDVSPEWSLWTPRTVHVVAFVDGLQSSFLWVGRRLTGLHGHRHRLSEARGRIGEHLDRASGRVRVATPQRSTPPAHRGGNVLAGSGCPCAVRPGNRPVPPETLSTARKFWHDDAPPRKGTSL
jgi:hypothetical protein